MSYKWIGAVMIVGGCAGTGFSIAAGYQREVQYLRSLIKTISFMKHSLQYELTPLPDLCRKAGNETFGSLREVFLNLARELQWQSAPDVSGCAEEAIRKSHELPLSTRSHVRQLGRSLGRFDLPGQLQELDAMQESCKQQLSELTRNLDVRMRSFRTLGLCAGAALAILLV